MVEAATSKPSRKEYYAAYRAANREKLLAMGRDYREATKEVRQAKARARYAANREAIRERQRLARLQRLEEVRARDRAYRAANREHINARSRRYRKAYFAQKFREDPSFRLLHNMRNRVGHALAGKRKGGRTMELVGCTASELRAHIQSKFLPGMHWGNRNEWHVDHIRPCASFDLESPAEQRACFHYSNLQPLWALDNITKGTTQAA